MKINETKSNTLLKCISTAVLHIMLPRKQDFHENQLTKSNTLLKCISTRTFHTSRFIWVKFGTEILHVMPLRNWRLHKNWYSDSYTVFMELLLQSTLQPLWVLASSTIVEYSQQEGFYRVPLPAARQTPNLEDQW